jgi:hypothetical protein
MKFGAYTKYFLAFIITGTLFACAYGLSTYFNNQKLESLQSIQDNVSIDILSSETQFSLLSELACSDTSSSVLSSELNNFADKIEYAEANFPASSDFTRLKKFYSILEIKDYLLMKKIADRCGTKNTSVFYFYTTEANCSECTKQSYVLTALKDKYPDLRVYSFDYNLDLSALRALIAIYDVDDKKLPSLVIGDKLYTGFHSLEDIEKLAKLTPPKDVSKTTDTPAVQK